MPTRNADAERGVVKCTVALLGSPLFVLNLVNDIKRYIFLSRYIKIQQKMGSVKSDRVVPVVGGSLLQFGGHLKELFPQDKEWINMNHGESFLLLCIKMR